MAYIRTSAIFDSESLNVDNIDVSIPSPHQSGDVIMISLSQDAGGTDIVTAASGWNLVSGSQSAVGAQRTVNYYKVAASSSEPDVNFTGTNEQWCGMVNVLAGADTTNPVNAFSTTNITGTTNSVTSTAVTTTVDNCLLLLVSGFDGVLLQTANPNQLNFLQRPVQTGGNTQYGGYINQEVAGVSSTYTFLLSNNEGGQLWTLAIKDANPSNPKMGPYSSQSIFPVIRLGTFIVHDAITFGSASALTPATVNGLGLSTEVPASLAISLSSSPIGTFNRIRSSFDTLGTPKYGGVTFTLTSTVNLSDAFLSFEFGLSISAPRRNLSSQLLLVLEDGSGDWAAYEISNSRVIVGSTAYTFLIDLVNFPTVASGGTIDLATVKKIAFLDPRTAVSGDVNIQEFFIKNIFAVSRVKLVGGSAESPASIFLLKNAVDGWPGSQLVSVQGTGQTLSRIPFQIGNPSQSTHSSTFGQSSELPLPYNDAAIATRVWKVEPESVVNSVYAGSTGVVGLNSTIFATATRQKFLIDPASSSLADWDFSGTSFIGYDIENKAAGVFFNQATFVDCYQVVLEGSGLTGCTVNNSLVSVAVITDSPNLISDSTFISAGTGHAVEMTDVGTFDFEGNVFTGYGADSTTDAAIFNNSGGLITLDLAPGDIAPTVRNGTGASTVINAFVASVGLEFTGLVAGSQVVIYNSGTTTEIFRDNNSGTTEEYTEVTASLFVDYTIMQAGFVPIRVAGLTLTSVQVVPVQQVEDRAYQASSGLTFNTNAFANTGTKIFDLTAASTVQIFYSFMIEAWIAQTTLRNVQFPIEPNGPNSYTFAQGWEFADQDAIDFLSRDGMRYRNAGVVTASWLAILSIGEATGFQGRFQQVVGAASVNAKATGAFDQLIQVFGDATHGNFDYSGYLTLKYQPNGFYQAVSDVDAIYGTLADELYVTALEPAAILGFVTGDPSVTGLSITNHGASPVSWDVGNGAKNYSITITDSAANSAENVIRWINYNLSLGGTFQGTQAFNWPDMVVTDGTSYETARGTVIGSAGALLKGVRVIRTGDVAHPGFTRFQSDDGTYGLVPTTIGIDFTGLVAGSQVVIYEAGTTNELFRDNNSGTTESYSAVAATDDVDYTIMKAGCVPIRVTGLTISSVQSIPVQQIIDRAYVASTGLTFNTNAFANPGTSIFDLTTASTVQNFYSFMIEAWIAQSSLRNVQFPIEPNGPNSFTLSLGWEFADQDAIDFLSRDGMRYTDGGDVTAIWLSILSIGEATGFQGRYQQVIGAAATAAAGTGVFDQLIQVFGDATHGNFDYDDYLVLKYQPNGFYQSTTDVVSIYGNVADESYVVALEPQAIPGFVTGDPAVTGLSITNHGASPVSWDAGNGAKNYSVTITDSSTNTAENVMRWVNYNLSLGGTFQGTDAFNWPDLILTDGTNYETVRGTVIGSAGALLKGVRVIRTGDVAHPGFTRFQADDGTYGLAPEVQSVTVTNAVTGTRIQLYDLTSDTELYNDIPTFPFTWQDSAPYVADREIRLRAMWVDEDMAKLFIDTIVGTSTDVVPALSIRLNQVDDTVYITNGIDGSLVMGITIDDAALLIEVDNGSFTWQQIYAFETHWLYTEEGIRDEGRIIDAIDNANYVFNEFKIKNVSDPSIPLAITAGWGRDSVTGQSITLIDTTGGAIFSNPDLVIPFATGSGVTSQDKTDIIEGVRIEMDDASTKLLGIKKNTDLIPAAL